MKNRNDWKEVVHEKMSGRKDFWPALHFTRFHATKDSANPELMEVKASLTKVLCPGKSVYILFRIYNKYTVLNTSETSNTEVFIYST